MSYYIDKKGHEIEFMATVEHWQHMPEDQSFASACYRMGIFTVPFAYSLHSTGEAASRASLYKESSRNPWIDAVLMPEYMIADGYSAVTKMVIDVSRNVVASTWQSSANELISMLELVRHGAIGIEEIICALRIELDKQK